MEYRLVITQEWEDYDDLSFYAENPEEGIVVADLIIKGVSDLEKANEEYEGLFYQIFKKGEDERFDSGVFAWNPVCDGIVCEGIECNGNCNECFYYEELCWPCGDWVEQYKPDGCNKDREIYK